MTPTARPSRFPAFRVATGIILLVGVLGSGLAFRDSRQRERERIETEFARRAALLHALTGEVFNDYDAALFSISVMFTLQGGVTRDDFARVARSLAANNPGVQAFEWVPVVPAAERAAAEAALARDFGGHPREFTERNAAGRLVRAAERPEYFPITYLEPLAGNESALGYDLKTGPTLAELERARRTRHMALTGQIRLVQEKHGQMGIVMIQPVSRPGGPEPRGLLGYVQGVFRVQDMLESVRSQTWRPDSILDMLFIDDSEPDPARRVLYYRPTDPAAPRAPVPSEAEFRQGLSQAFPLSVGGRQWKLIYRPRSGWVEDQLSPLAWVRTAGVLAITGLLAGLVFQLGRRAEVIKREVAERTAELNESQRQLSSLLHSLPGMAFRCQYDDQLKVIFVSIGVEALTGHAVAEFTTGQVHFRDLIHREDVERVRCATRDGLEQHREIEVEYRLVARDGAEKWVLSRCRGVYAADGRPLFLEGLAIDITARKQAEADKLGMERRLLETQKLESLGLLAGGVAHDFNNILTGILGNASLARLQLGEDSPIMSNLHKIELASARAAELCQQMLSYSGQSSFLVEPVDLGRLVQDTLPLLHVSLASRARLHLDLGPSPAVALADATQLRQIVMNLVINATDAMGERSGDIFVATGVRAFDRDFLSAAHGGPELAPGDYGFIEVRDTGCGMTPETLTKIFDPFFTTKFAGRGLGLAAVRGIVRGHQGALHVSSRPGRGSTFTLVLPLTVRPLAVAESATDAPRTYSGRVLVIDDETPVRETAAAMLATFGFTTVTAEDGTAGIARFALDPAGFAFVLLDLTMPGLGGEETLTTLRAIAPDVRVLLVSGYSENPQVARLARAGRLQFMQKPFTLTVLRRKLDELLG